MKKSKTNDETLATHAGEDHGSPHGDVTPPVHVSTVYRPKPGTECFSANNYDQEDGFVYTRWGNPTINLFEQKLAALEGAEDAMAFSSGIAAVTGLFLTTLKRGDHLILSNVCYAGIPEFVHDILVNFGVEATFVNTSDLAKVKAAFQKNTKLVFVDTPANPTLRIADIAALAEMAHEHGAQLAIDSTWATPIATKPVTLGADFVMHSVSKYIGGHGDIMGGALVGSKKTLKPIRLKAGIHLGAGLSPELAWLASRSLHTLPIRMAAHEKSATVVANYLEKHPKVARVIYPGLVSHPHHALAKKQMKNYSGMMAVRLKGGAEAAKSLLNKLELITHAVSLGKTKTLAFWISTEELQKNSFKMSPEELEEHKEWAGEGLIRMSVGIEDPDDIIADLAQGLSRI